MTEPSPIAPSTSQALPVNAPQAAPTPPTPQPAPENASKRIVEPAQAQPEAGSAPPSSETPETPPPTESERTQWARLAAQEKRIRAQERQAKELARQAKADREAVQAQKAELDGLLHSAKTDPEGVKRLLQKAGLTMDDIARAVLQLPAADQSPEAQAKQALEETRKLKEQLAQEREDTRKQAVNAQIEASFANDVARTTEFINGDPDKYELIRDNGAAAYREVVKRAWNWIRANQAEIPGRLTADDERALVSHFADEVEAQLTEYATTTFDRLVKTKVGKGKSPHSVDGNQVRPSGDTITTPLDPHIQAIVDTAKRDKHPSKFITNASTVSNRPNLPTIEVRSGSRSDEDQRIAEIVKQLAPNVRP